VGSIQSLQTMQLLGLGICDLMDLSTWLFLNTRHFVKALASLVIRTSGVFKLTLSTRSMKMD